MKNKGMFFNHKLEVDSLKRGELKGVAYSGQVIPQWGGYENFIIDISTLTVAKEKTTILRDHLPSQVAGSGKVTIDGNTILLEGILSKKSAHGKEIIDLAEDGVDWEMSVGLFDGIVEQFDEAEYNGITINNGWVLKNAVLREVSVVAIGADVNTSTIILKHNKGESMFTKDQWAKFACACGGHKDSTPEEIEAKLSETKLMTEEQSKKIEELEAEIETLRSEAAAKQAEIDAIKEAADAEERAEEIETALNQAGVKLSAEKIQEAAKSKDKTEILLSVIADMSVGKKEALQFSKKTVVNKEIQKEGTPKTAQQINLEAKKLVESGAAKDLLTAISMVEN